MTSPLDFSQLYRRLELDYQGLKLIFHLELTCADINRFKRNWFAYLYLRDIESQRLQKEEKLNYKRRNIKGFLKDFLKETLWAQERVVALVGDYLTAGKITLVSHIKDKNACLLTEEMLKDNPYFYELLVTLAQRLSVWEETLAQSVKKKPFWRLWFA